MYYVVLDAANARSTQKSLCAAAGTVQGAKYRLKEEPYGRI